MKEKIASVFLALVLSSPLFAVPPAIVLPPHATRVERFAASELAEGLGRVTGEKYAVTEADPGRGLRYFVGGDPLGEAPWKVDEIRLVRKGDRIILTGDATRGPIYAVNEYLERIVGVRWWTRTESDYPHRPDFKPPEALDVRYAPPFAYRETFYRDPLIDAKFKVRIRNNVTSKTRYIIAPTVEAFAPPEMGGNHRLAFFKGRRSSYHSFFEILPPKVYAKDHPDWYSEIDGKRIGGGQLCVTNPEMLREYVKNTLKLLREDPTCDSIQVSQNDHFNYCQCAKCRARIEAEGSVSGPYLEFANKVAEEVEKEFPNVMIDTFAYQFTRKAPKTVRPRKNVLIRLCDIECAFNRPLADSPAAWKQNGSFLADLADWSRIAAGRLYVWDYQANFKSYMLPHPNLHVFAENIRAFRKYGAVGIFEQGDALCEAGDFAALKAYVTSHLLWNPDLDWIALRDEFLAGYYGAAAAPHLARVLELAEKSASRADAPPMRCYHETVSEWIPAETAQAALQELARAHAAAEKAGEPYLTRIRKAELPWLHAQILHWKDWQLACDRNALVRDWLRALDEFKINAYRETTTRQTFDDYVVRLKKELAVNAGRTDSVPILSASSSERPDLPGSFFRLDMKLEPIPTNEFRIALSASNPICMQPMVRDFLWVAAYAAARLTDQSLSGRCLQVHLPCAMQGTSAGLAMALGIAEALEGRTLPTDFAVTGEILPNGLVGPVQGMPSKISAAAKAGIRRVAIPTQPRTETVDGKEVDPVEWGRRLGVEVVRVRTLAEARAWMMKKPYAEPAVDARAALSLPSDIEAELTRQTTNLLGRLAAGGATNSEDAVRAELKAGRFFSARQLATLDFAQWKAEHKVPPPESVDGAGDSRIEEWISTEFLGLEEKLLQESAQGAPTNRMAEGLSFVGWLKALQTEQTAAFLDVCGGAAPKAKDLSAQTGLAYALADLFEQTAVTSVSNVRGRSVDRIYQMLYPVDPPMLIWRLTMMRLQHGVLRPSRARLAWAIAAGSTELARFGGGLQICEEKETERLSVNFGCDVYLDEYVDGARKAALAAIAAARARGEFPALALDAFERGERWWQGKKGTIDSRLLAFEAYLRSYLLCGDQP